MSVDSSRRYKYDPGLHFGPPDVQEGLPSTDARAGRMSKRPFRLDSDRVEAVGFDDPETGDRSR